MSTINFELIEQELGFPLRSNEYEQAQEKFEKVYLASDKLTSREQAKHKALRDVDSELFKLIAKARHGYILESLGSGGLDTGEIKLDAFVEEAAKIHASLNQEEAFDFHDAMLKEIFTLGLKVAKAAHESDTQFFKSLEKSAKLLTQPYKENSESTLKLQILKNYYSLRQEYYGKEHLTLSLVSKKRLRLMTIGQKPADYNTTDPSRLQEIEKYESDVDNFRRACRELGLSELPAGHVMSR